MEINIKFLDGYLFNYGSNKSDEIEAVDEAIKAARKDGITSEILFYDLPPTNLKTVVGSHT